MNATPQVPMTITDISAGTKASSSTGTTAEDANTPSGGLCGCCAPLQATSVSATSEDAVTAEYSVTGLTCGSCAGRVSSALSALDGVQDVQITLVPGGVSIVSVISSQSLPRTSVQDVVEKTGYQLTTA